MTAMLMPSVNSYFAIYTLMDPDADCYRSSPNWDLHATATDRNLAISHAKMLVLQPGVGEVQVKEVIENVASGLVRVKNIKCWKRGQTQMAVRVAVYVCVALGAAVSTVFLF